jgi:hypothetical protein
MPNAIIISSFFIIAPYKGGSTCAAGPGLPAYIVFVGALLNPGDGLLNPVEGLLNPGDGLPNPGDGLLNPGDGLLNPDDGLLNPDDGLPYPFDELLPYPVFMPLLTPANFSWVRPNAATPIMAPIAI